MRDGRAKLGPEQPRALRDGRPVRPQVHPERVGVEARAEVENRQLLRVRLALQHRVVVRAHLGLREVDLPGLQRQQLRILVGHDLEREPVEQRQLLAALVLPPVARVPLEDQPLARLVRLQDERPEADDLGRRRGRIPRLGQRACDQRRLQLVAGQDCEIVEQPDARAEGRREAHDHRGGVRRAHRQRLAADAHRLAENRRHLLVVDRPEREEDVGGRERRAVREGDAGAQFQRVSQAVGRRRPRFGQPRLEFLRLPVDPDELGLREGGHDLQHRVAPGVAVERPRLGAQARHQLVELRLRVGRRRLAPAPARHRRQHGKAGGQELPLEPGARVSRRSISLSSRPIRWPVGCRSLIWAVFQFLPTAPQNFACNSCSPAWQCVQSLCAGGSLVCRPIAWPIAGPNAPSPRQHPSRTTRVRATTYATNSATAVIGQPLASATGGRFPRGAGASGRNRVGRARPGRPERLHRTGDADARRLQADRLLPDSGRPPADDSGPRRVSARSHRVDS